MEERLYEEERVNNLLKNIKKGVETDFNLMVGVQSWELYVKFGTTKKERLQILIMCYVANPKLEELNNWTINDLLNYIKETDEYYEKDKEIIERCVNLINELGE